jgi:hypothetical protein
VHASKAAGAAGVGTAAGAAAAMLRGRNVHVQGCFLAQFETQVVEPMAHVRYENKIKAKMLPTVGAKNAHTVTTAAMQI